MIKSRLLELDCLRGLAAILVVTFHFTLNQPDLKQIFKFGCIGVDLFFMISGFVIFLTIQKTNDYKRFLLSRFARLYPAYWVAVTLTTISIVVWSYIVKQPVLFPTLKDFVINLTMVQCYFKTTDIDVVYWTLLVELLFYLFILIVFLSKRINKIELIGLIGVILCFIYETFLKQRWPNYYQHIKIYFPLINFFPLFIAGILFYKLKFESVTLFRISVIIACYIVQIFLFHDTNKMAFTMTQTQYALFVGLFFSLFFLYCYNQLKFIINKAFLFLGKISYSLYLTHNYIAFNLLIPLLTLSKHIKLNYWVADFVIVLPAMLFIAFVINKYVEIPIVNFAKSIGTRSENGYS